LARVRSEPPWDFLFSASPTSLQNFELSRLNLSANLRREIVELLDLWVNEAASAQMARWLIEQRRAGNICEGCGAPRQDAEESDNISGEGLIPRPDA